MLAAIFQVCEIKLSEAQKREVAGMMGDGMYNSSSFPFLLHMRHDALDLGILAAASRVHPQISLRRARAQTA